MSGEIVIFTAPDGIVHTEVRLDAETLWLTQNQLQDLFSTDRTSLVKHIKNILETGELEQAATCAKFAQVRQEGKRQVSRDIIHYNLDMILSVGYRVNSIRGTQFRIWANRVLKEHLVQGYTLNHQRLKEQYNRIVQLRGAIQLLVCVGILILMSSEDPRTQVLKVQSGKSIRRSIAGSYTLPSSTRQLCFYT